MFSQFRQKFYTQLALRYSYFYTGFIQKCSLHLIMFSNYVRLRVISLVGTQTTIFILFVYCLNITAIYLLKGVLHPWALFLKTLYIFLKNKATLDKWIWSEMFKGTQKSQFSFSRDHCCEFTVKDVRKSIFFCVLSHKSITTWVSEIPVK